MIFIHFIPCVALVLLNTKLILGVAEAEKKRYRMTNRQFRRNSKYQFNGRYSSECFDKRFNFIEGFSKNQRGEILTASPSCQPSLSLSS